MKFKKVIDACEQHGFLKRVIIPRITENLFKVGPVGALLQENLRLEWLQNIVTNKEYTVFLNNDDEFAENYEFAKSMCLENLPFGIAEFVNKKSATLNEMFENKEFLNKNTNFNNLFEDMLVLKCTMFVSPVTATQFFYQWQKQRRMWWRKISASPGRYSLTDIKSENNSQYVEIQAKYAWGNQLLETLMLKYDVPPPLNANQLQFKDGRRMVQAANIASEISLPTMVLNSLCDAFEEPMFQENPRPLFRFHRKLAPYKISFAIASSQKPIVEELSQLALYLCKQLRDNHISCLLLPSSVKHTLEAQWKQYDQLGIPYNIFLNEKTLKNGIIQLRSRDTTLKEQVHVTELIPYVEKIFKHY